MTIPTEILEVTMTQEEFETLLEWRMCSDPWPTASEDQMDTIDRMLDRIADENFGYGTWTEAYHSF